MQHTVPQAIVQCTRHETCESISESTWHCRYTDRNKCCIRSPTGFCRQAARIKHNDIQKQQFNELSFSISLRPNIVFINTFHDP